MFKMLPGEPLLHVLQDKARKLWNTTTTTATKTTGVETKRSPAAEKASGNSTGTRKDVGPSGSRDVTDSGPTKNV